MWGKWLWRSLVSRANKDHLSVCFSCFHYTNLQTRSEQVVVSLLLQSWIWTFVECRFVCSTSVSVLCYPSRLKWKWRDWITEYCIIYRSVFTPFCSVVIPSACFVSVCPSNYDNVYLYLVIVVLIMIALKDAIRDSWQSPHCAMNCLRQVARAQSYNKNNNRIQRCNLRFFAMSSLRHKLSPTCML